MKLAKKSAAFIATEKLLIAIRDHKPIDTTGLNSQSAATRLVGHCEKGERVSAVKEVRALAECGLREAVDLHNKYIFHVSR